EGDGNAGCSRLQTDLRFEYLWVCRLRLHREFLDVLAVHPQRRAHRLIAGLFAIRLDANGVIAFLEESLATDLPPRAQDRAAAAALAGALRKHSDAAYLVLGRFRWFDDDKGAVENGVGGDEISLQQQRRQRQHIADVVEAVADIVGGEIGGRLEVDAD